MCAKPYAFSIEDKTTPHHGGGAQDLLFNMISQLATRTVAAGLAPQCAKKLPRTELQYPSSPTLPSPMYDP